MQRNQDLLKQEYEQMKNDNQLMIEQTSLLHQMHLEESSELNSINEEIKRMNKALSSIRKEKECIGCSIVQMKKHINQIEDKIVAQSQATKEFIWAMAQFQSSISKTEGGKIGRNVKSNSSLMISKSLK